MFKDLLLAISVQANYPVAHAYLCEVWHVGEQSTGLVLMVEHCQLNVVGSWVRRIHSKSAVAILVLPCWLAPSSFKWRL